MMDQSAWATTLLICGSILNVCFFVGNIVAYPPEEDKSVSLKFAMEGFGAASGSVLLWWFFGWTFANGSSNAYYYFCGIDRLLETGNYEYAWFYELSLLLVSQSILAATIPSKYKLVIVGAFVLAIFPVEYHWGFTVNGFASPYRSGDKSMLLSGCGVLDASGASVVFMSPTIVCWVEALMVQLKSRFLSLSSSRHENYVIKRKKLRTIENNIEWSQIVRSTLNALGVLSVVATNNLPVEGGGVVAGRRLMIAVIAGSVSCCTTIPCCYLFEYQLSKKCLRNSFLAGIIAAASCAATINAQFCLLLGFVAGILNIGLVLMLERCELTDLAAVSTYGIQCMWGLVAAGLMTTKAHYISTYAGFYNDGTSRAEHCKGVFYGSTGAQLAANIQYMLSIFGWSAAIAILMMFPFVYLLNTDGKVQEEFLANGRETSAVGMSMEPCSRCGKLYRENAMISAMSPREMDVEALLDAIIGPGHHEDESKETTSGSKAQADKLPHVSGSGSDDSFFECNGYSWDFVLVLPMPEPKSKMGQSVLGDLEGGVKNMARRMSRISPGTVWKGAPSDASIAEERFSPSDLQYEDEDKSSVFVHPIKIIQRLQNKGIETYAYFSSSKEKIIVLLRASVERFRKQAEFDGYRLLLKESLVEDACQAGYRGKNPETKEDIVIKPFRIAADPDYTSLRPYEQMYVPCTEHTWGLFAKAPGYKHPFSPLHRNKLMRSILISKNQLSCGFNTDALLKCNAMDACFPLHDYAAIARLEKEWLAWDVMPWRQPDNLIREYFGDHIGLYFHFLAKYLSSLIPLAFCGGFVTVHLVVITSAVNYSVVKAVNLMYSTPAFSFLVCCWATSMLESWRTEELKTAFRNGMDGFERLEADRPEFESKEERDSYIDGKKRSYFPLMEQQRRHRISTTVITLLSLFVLVSISGIFWLKFYLVHVKHSESGALITDICNAIFIQIMRFSYTNIAKELTENENCRTDTIFEDSLIGKLFVFNFINSYAPYAYIAFVKRAIGDQCAYGSCMVELAQMLLTVYASGFATKNIVPIFFGCAEKAAEVRNDVQDKSPEKEFGLEDYDDIEGPVQDYLDLSLLFGFLTLFIAALPFAPLISIAFTFVEMRSDGYKLIRDHRRPLPRGAEDIGTWYIVFEIIALISVFSNAGLVFYTMDILPASFSRLGALWMAMGFVIAVLLCRMLIAYSMSTVRAEVDIQVQRREHIINKIINKVPDEEEFKEQPNLHAEASSVVVHSKMPTKASPAKSMEIEVKGEGLSPPSPLLKKINREGKREKHKGASKTSSVGFTSPSRTPPLKSPRGAENRAAGR